MPSGWSETVEGVLPTVGSTDQAVNATRATIAMPNRIRMGVSFWGFRQRRALLNSPHPNCVRLASLCRASQKNAFIRYGSRRGRDQKAETGVCFWPLAEIPKLSINVRFRAAHKFTLSSPAGTTFCYNKTRRCPLRLPRTQEMATREACLAEFSQDTPKENRPLQILCEDKCGTYLVPYPCQRSDGAWRKVGSAKTIEATVIGWRIAPRSWR
jgi:hypothetical protein